MRAIIYVNSYGIGKDCDMPLTLMRHCEPRRIDGKKRYTGSTDLPLTDEGRRCAKLSSAEFADFDAIYCSTLSRALETARIIGAATGIAVISTPALCEIDMGEWEGRSFEEIRSAYPVLYAQRGAQPMEFAAPGGESHAGVAARAGDFLAKLDPGGKILAVTHLGVIRSLFRKAGLIDDAGFWNFRPSFGERIEFTP